MKVSNVSVELANQTILDNVSFKLKRGTTLAIVGPNGAGKTTLFRVLLNLVPHTGKIVWSDHVKIGYVPQILSVKDIPISVKEFLSIRSSSNLESSLNSVGLDSRSIMNKSLSVLSGGQLRRVLIAWAIIDKPNVLLFDEPTSGVDVGGEEAIYQMLKRLTRENEIALLLITHDIHIIREYSDYMLVLNKCVTFFGESKEITNPDTQKLIFGEPVCLEREPDYG
nr:metal ABC transporter ATP-binding protein [Candidatus Freyarchaeota archaeon]